MLAFKIIKQYLKLIKEGKSFEDKKLLTKYFLKMPIRILYRILGYKFQHSLSSNVIIKNEDGNFFCGKNIFAAWTASSLYEPELKPFFELFAGTFIDVGANIGKYSIILGKKLKDNGQVISIEPEPRNFEILNKNIKLNNLKNVTAINNGLYSKKGKLDFYLTSEKSGDGAHSLIKKTNNKIQIKVDTLDNIIKEKGLKDIKLIKIDVEGAEANVLKGAKKTLKKYHPKLIFEAWDETYFKKIKNILDKYNYKFEKIGSQNYFAF